MAVNFNRQQVVDAMRKVAAGAINKGAKSMQEHAKNRLGQHSGWQSKPGGWPGNRSGRLMENVGVKKFASPKDLHAKFGSNIPQGAYMQYGVKASKKGGLTVPVTEEAANGLISYGGIRGLARAKGLTFIRTYHKQGQAGVWAKVKGTVKRKNQRLEVWVVLRKSVKARPWATLAVKEHRATSIKEAKEFFKVNWQAEAAKIAATIGGKP